MFGASLRESFDKGFSDAEKRFNEEAMKIKGDSSLTFNEMQKELGEKSKEIFMDFWTEFQKTGEYISHQGFFDNLFNVKINPKLQESSFSEAQETIAKKVDSLVSELNVKHKNGLDALLYDGKTSWKEYYDNIKRMSEKMSEDLRKA